MYNTKVISGFPGVGKTFAYKELQRRKFKVLDSDSSQFSWASKGVRNPLFPSNYINHIKENIGLVNFIFVSSHEDVRKALQAADIKYTLIYPAEECKVEYLKRYSDRGSSEGFLKLVENNWEEWIEQLKNETFPFSFVLGPGGFLLDALTCLYIYYEYPDSYSLPF